MTSQLDLFGDRERRRAEARARLLDFDLRGARALLLTSTTEDSSDGDARDALAVVDELATRIAAMVVGGTDPIAEPFVLAAELESSLLPAWHSCVARAAERRWGPAARVGQDPVGLHWLLAGRLVEAHASLALHLRQQPADARAHAYRGDVLWRIGDRAGARSSYLRAFTLDPHAVDRDRLADPQVRELEVLATTEYEVPGDPIEWVAAVGVVEHVLPFPEPELPGAEAELPAPPRREPQGLRFYELLVRERTARDHERRVELRSEMKRLCLALLAAYLRER